MRVVIAGGTGFIGRALTRAWLDAGAAVTVVSRRAGGGAGRRLPAGAAVVAWDDPAWRDAVRAADVVVNLAGATIARFPWTAAYKQTILESRVATTRRLVEAICRQGDGAGAEAGAGDGSPRTRVLVNGSAIGYYGDGGDRILTEDDGPGDDFLARVVRAWEDAARPAADAGVRLVLVRTGHVLGRGGGFLGKVLPPFRLGLGGPFGDGRQWLSWIHVDDYCRLVRFAAETGALSGPVNGTAPNPVTNAEFARVLGRVLGRPAVLRVPAGVLRAALGEMAGLLLEGQRVIPARAQAAGFSYGFPELRGALEDLLRPGAGAKEPAS